MTKTKRCPKHHWQEETAEIVFKVKLSPGSINYLYPHIPVEVCSRCYKIRNIKSNDLDVLISKIHESFKVPKHHLSRYLKIY